MLLLNALAYFAYPSMDLECLHILLCSHTGSQYTVHPIGCLGVPISLNKVLFACLYFYSFFLVMHAYNCVAYFVILDMWLHNSLY